MEADPAALLERLRRVTAAKLAAEEGEARAARVAAKYRRAYRTLKAGRGCLRCQRHREYEDELRAELKTARVAASLLRRLQECPACGHFVPKIDYGQHHYCRGCHSAESAARQRAARARRNPTVTVLKQVGGTVTRGGPRSPRSPGT